jgi:hypothetical protein
MDANILVQNITVTFSYSGWSVYALSMQGPGIGLGDSSATLEMTAGSLFMGTVSNVGNVVQQAGTLEFGNGIPLPSPPNPPKSIDFSHPDEAGLTSVVFNIDQSAGATIKIDSGVLRILGDNARLAGTVTDAGRTDAGRSTLEIVGTTSLASTAVLDMAVLAIQSTGATLELESDRTFSDEFVMSGQTHLYLGGHTFTLTGANTIGGTVHDGTLIVDGAGSANALTIQDGATVDIDAAISAVNGFLDQLNIGGGSAGDGNLTAGTLNIKADGTWDMVGSYGATLKALGVLDIDGIFKRSVDGESVVRGGTVNSTGTIEATLADSTITFVAGTGSLGGHVTGLGKIGLSGDYTFAAGLLIDVAGLEIAGTSTSLTLEGDVSYAGIFQGGTSSTLHLGGHTLTFGGSAELTGTVSTGSVHIEGTGTASGLLVTDGAVLAVDGTMTQEQGSFNLGLGNATAGTLDIGDGGTWNIAAGYSMSLTASSIIDNSGLFEKTAGTQSQVIGGTVNNTGTIKSDTVLSFSANSGAWGGHLTGAGEIDVAGNFTLAADIVIDVATFGAGGTLTLSGDLTYDGHYVQSGIAQRLNLDGHDITLGGDSFISGSVQGGGSMILTGTGTISQTTFFNGAVLDVRGDYDQTLGLDVGFSNMDASVVIADGATWNITALNGAIDLTDGSTFTNNGLFQKTGASQTAVDRGTFVNSGTIKVDAGTLSFTNGAGSFAGTLTGAGAIEFGNLYTLENGLTADIAGLTNLANTTLTVGTSGGSVTLGSASRETRFENGGMLVQKAGIALTGDLINDDSGTYSLETGDVEGAAGSVTNNGFWKKSGSGASQIDGTFTNNDWVEVDSGSLAFADLDNVGIIRGVITRKNGTTTVTADAAGQMTLTGGTGDNLLFPGQVPTHVDGGAGDDTLLITASMTLNAGSIVNVEHVSVRGEIVVDLSKLTSGEDILVEGSNFGSASVRGTQGADTFASVVGSSGFANNTFVGGGGDDTYILQGLGETVTEDKNAGKDLVKSSADYTLTANVENLTLTGTDGITGTGNALANAIRGNGGNNLLSGASGKDNMTGGGGNDILAGGKGIDKLAGSAGDDVFVFAKGDTGKTEAKADLIKDFSNGDTIDLSAIDAIANTAKDNAFKFVGTHALKHAGDLRYEIHKGDTWISGDTNGDGKSDFLIHLDHAVHLQKSDFIL